MYTVQYTPSIRNQANVTDDANENSYNTYVVNLTPDLYPYVWLNLVNVP